MFPWEDPEFDEHIRRIVRYGCMEYRKVFSAAGWECSAGATVSPSDRASVPKEVYHEFLLYLDRKRVTLDGVTFWRAYLSKTFQSFAEDVRRKVERGGHVYGDLEEAYGLDGEGRESADCVPRAARRHALEIASSKPLPPAFRDVEQLRRLDDFPINDQLNCLLEHYPLVRDCETAMRRLRLLYQKVCGTEFPEEEADELWESQRGGGFLKADQHIELVRIALCKLRQDYCDALLGGNQKSAGFITLRIAALKHRETELASRLAFLLRFKPSQVFQILPARRRPTLNALTVALHRSRERLKTCGASESVFDEAGPPRPIRHRDRDSPVGDPCPLSAIGHSYLAPGVEKEAVEILTQGESTTKSIIAPFGAT
jgi:hypothetical protein